MDLSLSPGSVRPGWRACSASLSRNRINPVSIQPTLSQLSQRRDALWRSACSTKSIERARNESHHGAQHYSCEWKYFSCLLGLHFSGKLTFGPDVIFFFLIFSNHCSFLPWPADSQPLVSPSLVQGLGLEAASLPPTELPTSSSPPVVLQTSPVATSLATAGVRCVQRMGCNLWK